MFVNEENTTSKTDMPMIWNRPPEVQLEKYRKGCTIAEMFAAPEDAIDPTASARQKKEVYVFPDVRNFGAILEQNCALTRMLNFELECVDSREEREVLKRAEEEEFRQLISDLYKLQVSEDIPKYYAYKCVAGKNNCLKFVIVTCPEDCKTFYDSNVIVDLKKWECILFNSVKQSKTSVWFKERYLRVTASQKSHRIKTRKENFEGLAKQFQKKRYDGTMLDPMRYGLDMEPVAKDKLSAEINRKVHDVGLVVCMKQPFLACSPDGVIYNDGDVELVEIKCPYTCKDAVIFDYDKGKSFVDYLVVNANNEPHLKENHIYYTQIQMSLYIMGLKSCKFFVYSSKDFVLLTILRNEDFLKTVVPVIENFYFKHFLPLLCLGA